MSFLSLFQRMSKCFWKKICDNDHACDDSYGDNDDSKDVVIDDDCCTRGDSGNNVGGHLYIHSDDDGDDDNDVGDGDASCN